MAYEVHFETSNRETFAFELSAVDAETGDDFDFTGAEVAIAITGDCPRLSATVGDGVEINAPNIVSVLFTADRMSRLPIGSHRIGMIFRRDDVTLQMLVGTVSVYDGIAKL